MNFVSSTVVGKIESRGGKEMGADIKRKIDFLEIVSEGEDAVLSYFNNLESIEERMGFYKLVVWGESSNCITGLSILGERLLCSKPGLTGLGKTVYEGRKDLIFK